MLADPQRALDLLETGVLGEPTSRGGRVELFVHLASADLADPTRAGGEVERLGAATRGLLAAWLGRPDLASITVRPVLDLHRPDTVDRHHPPAWMRETAVQGRRHVRVSGLAARDSRGCDLPDHITAYRRIRDGGAPAQTRLANLAPLCRTHHRLKTHSGWSYQRLADNHYLWTTPTGDLLAVHTRRRTRRRRP